jgi:hypothetical protein
VILSRLFNLQGLLLLALGAAVSVSIALNGTGTLAAFTAAATNDNSTLSTVNFSVSDSASWSALFSITDAVPGDWVQKNVTITTVGRGDLTLTLSDGSTGGVVAPLSGATDQALQIRVESCGATFAAAGCSGIAGLNGGSAAGVAAATAPTNSETVKYASVRTVAQTLQTGQPSGTYYYKVFMKIPSGTVGGGSGSDNDFINKSASVKWVWTLTSSAGSLRNTP